MEAECLQQVKKTHAILRTTAAKLVKLQSQYLRDKDLEDLDVICTSLNLESGKPADNSPIFTSPYSRAELDRILDDTQPWLDRTLGKEKGDDNICEALGVAYLLENYLH
jgi:hypothetical protein